MFQAEPHHEHKHFCATFDHVLWRWGRALSVYGNHLPSAPAEMPVSTEKDALWQAPGCLLATPAVYESLTPAAMDEMLMSIDPASQPHGTSLGSDGNFKISSVVTNCLLLHKLSK